VCEEQKKAEAVHRFFVSRIYDEGHQLVDNDYYGLFPPHRYEVFMQRGWKYGEHC
jgi:hypothetical protein